MTDRYAELAGLAARIARDVGDAIAVDDVAIVTHKQGRANFATRADHRAEDEIVRRLGQATPGVPVVAEERSTEAPPNGPVWVVDPIDGTLNFSRALPFYCVVIAYADRRRTRAAAVYAPRTAELFVASERGGATLNGARLHVSEARSVEDAFVVTSLAFGEGARKNSTFIALNRATARIRVVGSAALEMCYVAAGRFDLFVHGALHPWDIAAPWLIVREAGGAVLDRDTGRGADAFASRVVVGHPRLVKLAMAKIPQLGRRQDDRRGGRRQGVK